MPEYENTPDGRVVEVRRSGSGGWIIALLVVVALVVAAFAFGFINIDQVREAKVPTVSLQASGGQAPAFDVKTAKIAVGAKDETVKLPTVDVGTKDSTVKVPTISVQRADDPNAKDK